MPAITPRLSIIVIVYNMARQAMNTLYSLSADYQRNVRADDYEVIVVENSSGHNLDPDAVAALNGQFRYFLREEKTSQSPVGAINFGFSQARGAGIGLMIDGARMVTPRILDFALQAQRMDPDALVAVPGYNLGIQDQRFHRDTGHNENVEQQLLEGIQWQQNGYRLFDIASIGGANPKGFFHPLMECNCVFTSAYCLQAVGGANMDFQLPGGGSINLHLYRQLGLHKNTQRYFLMPGEGSFHQFHGGITTAQWDDLDEVLESHRRQLHSYWPGGFHSLRREPILLGAANSHAQHFLHYSARFARQRFSRLKKHDKPCWADDNRLDSDLMNN
jgi:glycosyltransferase involved in cell wall biosynthesis